MVNQKALDLAGINAALLLLHRKYSSAFGKIKISVTELWNRREQSRVLRDTSAGTEQEQERQLYKIISLACPGQSSQGLFALHK